MRQIWDPPGDSGAVCVHSGGVMTKGKHAQWRQHLSPSPSPLPSPRDCPMRGNVFAVPVPSGIAVTWAI